MLVPPGYCPAVCRSLRGDRRTLTPFWCFTPSFVVQLKPNFTRCLEKHVASQPCGQIPPLWRMTRNRDFLFCEEWYILMIPSGCTCLVEAVCKFWVLCEVVWPLYDHFSVSGLWLGQILMLDPLFMVQIMPNFGHGLLMMSLMQPYDKKYALCWPARNRDFLSDT